MARVTDIETISLMEQSTLADPANGETDLWLRRMEIDEVVDKYRKWLNRPELVAAAKRELFGKDLVCFCAPKTCHGDVLLEKRIRQCGVMILRWFLVVFLHVIKDKSKLVNQFTTNAYLVIVLARTRSNVLLDNVSLLCYNCYTYEIS